MASLQDATNEDGTHFVWNLVEEVASVTGVGVFFLPVCSGFSFSKFLCLSFLSFPVSGFVFAGFSDFAEICVLSIPGFEN